MRVLFLNKTEIDDIVKVVISSSIRSHVSEIRL